MVNSVGSASRVNRAHDHIPVSKTSHLFGPWKNWPEIIPNGAKRFFPYYCRPCRHCGHEKHDLDTFIKLHRNYKFTSKDKAS